MSSILGPQASWWVKLHGRRLFTLSIFATSQDPQISRYYGVSRVDGGRGPLRFALEGRPYDWSRFDDDEHGRRQLALAGWTRAAAGKDGDRGLRNFASSRGGANVEVRVARHAGFAFRTST